MTIATGFVHVISMDSLAFLARTLLNDQITFHGFRSNMFAGRIATNT
jgi:hypothetical protein